MPERVVRCPVCGRELVWRPDKPFRPFCSQRCKLIDLGEWASERYRLPAEEGADEAHPGPERPA